MIKDVIVKTVEAVECPIYGLVTVEMCMRCPYFGGYAGFKRIRCRRR